jgi:uncharacterized membrane protein YeiH
MEDACTVRDVLLATVPTILHSDVYATAALAGSVLMIVVRKAGSSPAASAAVGGIVCFTLRVLSV